MTVTITLIRRAGGEYISGVTWNRMDMAWGHVVRFSWYGVEAVAAVLPPVLAPVCKIHIQASYEPRFRLGAAYIHILKHEHMTGRRPADRSPARAAGTTGSRPAGGAAGRPAYYSPVIR